MPSHCSRTTFVFHRAHQSQPFGFYASLRRTTYPVFERQHVGILHPSFRTLVCILRIASCIDERPTFDPCIYLSFLDEPRQRETFESSHSVILAILANNGARERRLHDGVDLRDKMTTRLAPFYLRCLLEARCRCIRIYTCTTDQDSSPEFEGRWSLLRSTAVSFR